MLISMTVASNTELSKDQAAHSRLLFNMTVQSVQQIRWWPEWNPENETAKATVLLHAASRSLYTSWYTQTIPDSIQLKAQPYDGTLTRYQPRLQLIRKCCVYIACCCYSPCVHKQVPGCTVAIVTLLTCSCKLLHCGVLGCRDCSCCTWNACMCW